MTAIVLTKNESANIGPCLASLSFVAEVVVVDAGSDDDTCRLATAGGARVVTRAWQGFGLQRRAAEAEARYPWVLMLDADERCSPALVDELCRHFSRWSQEADAISFPRCTWYMGRPMRWYRPFAADRILRCYRLGRAQWTPDRVHESLVCSGRIQAAAGVVDHHSYTSVTHHLRKASLYIDLWADQAHEAERRPRLWTLPFVLPVYLVRDLVLRRGLFDGWPGVVAAVITVFSSLMKRFRLYELQQSPCKGQS